VSTIRKGEPCRPCGPLFFGTRLESNAEVSVLDSVAVADATPWEIGHDQPDPIPFRTRNPDGCTQMAFDHNRELEPEVGLLVGSPGREVIVGYAESEITDDRRLLAPEWVKGLIEPRYGSVASPEGDPPGLIAVTHRAGLVPPRIVRPSAREADQNEGGQERSSSVAMTSAR
jgi:hypothetical protein